jgi:quercetin dioxygenase-like cupin family protein
MINNMSDTQTNPNQQPEHNPEHNPEHKLEHKQENLFDGLHLEPAPGMRVRPFAGSEASTVLHITLEAGATALGHQHPHEQYTLVVSGHYQYTVGHSTTLLKKGDVVYIPPNVWHQGVAETPVEVVEFFTPSRADLLEKLALLEGKG